VLIPFVPSKYSNLNNITSVEVTAIVVGTKNGPYITFSDTITGNVTLPWTRLASRSNPSTNAANAFPLVHVSQLKVDATTHMLLAATLDRGVYTLKNVTNHVACVWFQTSGLELPLTCSGSTPAPAVSGLSAGVIAAIAVSCTVGVVAVGAAVYHLYFAQHAVKAPVDVDASAATTKNDATFVEMDQIPISVPSSIAPSSAS
jgi:hypothetical protein